MDWCSIMLVQYFDYLSSPRSHLFMGCISSGAARKRSVPLKSQHALKQPRGQCRHELRSICSQESLGGVSGPFSLIGVEELGAQ